MLSRRFPIRPPGVGLHRGVPMEVYQAWGAVSASMLKRAAGQLRAFRYWLDEEPDAPTGDMRMGTAFHAMLLEPLFAVGAIIEVPGLKWDSPADKWSRVASGRPGKIPVCEGGVEVLEAMVGALRRTARVGDLLDACEDRELSAVWEDPRTGLLLRARFDAVLRREAEVAGGPLPAKWEHYHRAGDIIFDAKGTRSSGYDSFAGDVYRLGYHVSAALYREVYEGLTGRKVSRVAFLATEWEEPHLSVGYALGEDYEAIGRAEARELIAAVARGYAEGAWVDEEAVDAVDMEPPGWVVRRFEDGRLFGGGR